MSNSERPRKCKCNALTFDEHWKTGIRIDEEVLCELFTLRSITLLTHYIFVAAQVKTWRSDVYAHFKYPTIIQEDNIVKYKFVCKM